MTTETITISKNTLSILKNFESLNSNILVKPGNVLRTKNISGTGFAEAIVDEQFTTEFGIWNLHQFLGVISCCVNPTFDFEENQVNIQSQNGSVFTYIFSEPSLLTVPTRQPKVPENPTATARIAEDVWGQITRAASVMEVDDISFVSTADGLTAIVTDLSDPTSHKYSIDLGGSCNDHTFEVNFKISNLKILTGNYKIMLVEAKMIVFQHEGVNLTYWFGSESATSIYND